MDATFATQKVKHQPSPTKLPFNFEANLDYFKIWKNYMYHYSSNSLVISIKKKAEFICSIDNVSDHAKPFQRVVTYLHLLTQAKYV